MNDKLKRLRKEASMSYLKYLPHYFLVGMGETLKSE
jgi:hypothetical protein